MLLNHQQVLLEMTLQNVLEMVVQYLRPGTTDCEVTPDSQKITFYRVRVYVNAKPTATNNIGTYG